MSGNDDDEIISGTEIQSTSPLTKIPILQTVFRYASKKLSTPIKLAQVTSSWDETLRIYGAGALVWQKAYQEKPAKVTGFLHAACSKGGFAWVVKHLLAVGVDPNSLDKTGNAAIHHISRWCALSPGAIDCIPILVNGGADVNIKTKKNQVALEFALETGQHAAVKELLKCGADPKLVPFALHLAAASGDGECCRLLVQEHGYDVNESQRGTNYTPLHSACLNARTKVLGATKMLLKVLKADTTAVDAFGKTPFLNFLHGYLENTVDDQNPLKTFYETTIQDWIDVNPNVIHDREATTGDGVLHSRVFSTAASHQLTLRKLLSVGADVNAKNAKGETVLMVAVRRWGMNDPYHMVSKDGAKEISFMKILVEEFKARVGTISNTDGETVFDMIDKYKPNKFIVDYLENFRKQ